MRDSRQLLAQLTEWADWAEAHLTELYPAGCSPAPSSGAPSATSPPPPPPNAPGPRPARAASDMNATLESTVSFFTAAGGGSARPQSPVGRADTPDRPQR